MEYKFLGLSIFKYGDVDGVDDVGSAQYFDVEWLVDIPSYSKQFTCVVVHDDGTFDLYGEEGEEGPKRVPFTAVSNQLNARIRKLTEVKL